jgi:hypothetical protein
MQSSDSLASIGRHSGLPLCTTYPKGSCSFFAVPPHGGRRPRPERNCGLASCTGPLIDRPSSTETSFRRARASQVTGSSSSYVPRPITPPDAGSSGHRGDGPAVAFEVGYPLGVWKVPFSWLHAAAHMYVCLRIDCAVAVAAARLTSDWCGSTLVGRDSHPLDDEPNFGCLPHDQPPSGPALPGRTLNWVVAAHFSPLRHEGGAISAEEGQRTIGIARDAQRPLVKHSVVGRAQ